MSLASQLRKAAYAVPLVFALAASNANAIDVVELDQLDLSKPLPSACFADSSKGTAISKLKTAMAARGQKSVVAANQVVKSDDPFKELILTSNLQQGGEGYYIGSDHPMGQPGSGYCWTRNKQVFVLSVFNSKGVPAAVNKGEMGVALSNQDKAGTKVAIVALTEYGTLKVVNFNPETGKGTVVTADANGNTAANAAYLANAGYSSSLPDPIKAALGIPVNNKVTANGADKGTVVVASAAPR